LYKPKPRQQFQVMEAQHTADIHIAALVRHRPASTLAPHDCISWPFSP
jgi:hypothetical protein